ncbi:hypothetical protein BC832DRAFT_565299 [Gaertneriomyces semiglobifer]|nr:hypothetical protein BC832DRAFT_565299 [Gaertneriomyces semiglobifer]
MGHLLVCVESLLGPFLSVSSSELCELWYLTGLRAARGSLSAGAAAIGGLLVTLSTGSTGYSAPCWGHSYQSHLASCGI